MQRKYLLRKCKCGCGGITTPGKRFINHHHHKEMSEGIIKRMAESGPPMLGKHHTQEAKDKIREKTTGRVHSKETRIKMSKSKMGENNPMFGKVNPFKKHTPETIEKMRHAKSKKTRRKMSKYARNRKIEHTIKLIKSLNIRPNKTEMKFNNILDELQPNEWKYVGDGQLIIGNKCPDFANINGKKKLIELYGDYWHRGQNSEDRKKIFRKFGYDTLVIWEHELNNLEILKNKIEAF